LRLLTVSNRTGVFRGVRAARPQRLSGHAGRAEPAVHVTPATTIGPAPLGSQAVVLRSTAFDAKDSLPAASRRALRKTRLRKTRVRQARFGRQARVAPRRRGAGGGQAALASPCPVPPCPAIPGPAQMWVGKAPAS